MENPMKLLVVEDDEATCREYRRCCDGNAAVLLLGVTGSAREGLSLVEEGEPDTVVLDLELQSDNGLLFLSELRQRSLPRPPYVMVVTNNISPVTHNLAHKLGADFIITKTQTDYSVARVLSMLQSIHAALSEDAPAPASVSSPSVEERLDAELDAIGVSRKHKGRRYLRDAIVIIRERPQPKVSAILAQRYGVTSACVERAMQHAIDRAWKVTDIDTLEARYTARINPEKGVPTITEFVYYYAEKLSG